jgi:hypothetical protein
MNDEQNSEGASEKRPLPPRTRAPNPPAEYKAETVWIAPEMAQEILDNTRYNRQVSKGTVAKYARDMRNGKWIFNGAPIRYNGKTESGKPELLDGQHRLRALLEANMELPFLVISGIPANFIRTMDDGKARSLAQKFYVDGEKAPDVLAQLIQHLATFRTKGSFSGPAFTTSEYYDRLDSEGQVARDLAKEYKCKLPRNVRPGLLACCHLLFAEKAPEHAKQFCGDVVTGLSERGTAAREFREWVISLEKGEVRTATIGAVLIDCWNKECRGDQINRVRIPKRCPSIEVPAQPVG